MHARDVILRAAAFTGALVGLMSVFCGVGLPWSLVQPALVMGAPRVAVLVTDDAIRGQPVRFAPFESALAPDVDRSRRGS